MNEFEFIDNLRARFDGIGDPAIEGIGDDCAVIPIDAGVGAQPKEAFVVTTDMLVEGIHFLRRAITPRELGGKALAVNLSDVAAMGAVPVASFLSVSLPAECRGGWAAEFTEGYAAMSDRYGVKPAGGDTTSSLGSIAISVTVVGRAPLANLKHRRSARVGDVVAVAGLLGSSAAGLAEILNEIDGEGSASFNDLSSEVGNCNALENFASERTDACVNEQNLSTKEAIARLSRQIHNNPQPQVEEGAWLGAQESVHAMMDLSDGLASDLVHILRASSAAANDEQRKGLEQSLGAEIELTNIPTETTLDYAVNGGEDYVLLLTADRARWNELQKDFRARFGTPLYPVGRIVETTPQNAGKIIWLDNGNPVRRDWTGFRHF